MSFFAKEPLILGLFCWASFSAKGLIFIRPSKRALELVAKKSLRISGPAKEP